MNATASGRVVRLLAALLVVGAALFVIGVAVERRGAHGASAETSAANETGSEAAVATVTTVATNATAAETGNESAERDATSSAANATATGHAESATEQAANGESGGESGERLLGVNVESTPLVVIAVVAGVALAVALLRAPRRPVFALVVVLASVWTVADITESIHQHREGRGGIAALAAVIAAIHLLVGVLAVTQLNAPSQRPTAAIADR